ncbi:neurogenic locus notch protein 1 [Biomphalaria glabrata]|nr:neurogenic locus notch protein 1 [Biomphalaria glabrata]
MPFCANFCVSFFLIGYVCSVPVDVPNKCPQPSAAIPAPRAFYYVHPDDCTSFFSCSFGVPHQTYCAPGTRFSNVFNACATEFSHYDTCSRENAVRECSRGATLIGHPTICQRYYNCSDHSIRDPRGFLKEFESECPYPQLFDIVERRCKSFKEAYCGPYRNPDVEPCAYVNNLCGTSHCQPCNDRFPSCAGLSDGFHEHPLRLWTPYYIECDTQRTINARLMCPSAPVGGAGIYSPVKKTCVSLWEVPRDKGGLEPSCDGKAAGKYRTDENPAVYYTCPGAVVAYCPVGTVFRNGSCS